MTSVNIGSAAYAREIGGSRRAIARAGGPEKLRALDPEIRGLLLKPYNGHQPTKAQLILRRAKTAKQVMRKAAK